LTGGSKPAKWPSNDKIALHKAFKYDKSKANENMCPI
jgi:hypothetical protein